MATLEDVRNIASRLPGSIGPESSESRFGFSVLVKGKPKGFLWTWAERIDPKKPKVINDGVIAVVVPSAMAKELLLESDPSIFFTEDHYNGFLAVLVRLAAITPEELEPLILEAWKCKAPKDVARAFFETEE